MNGAVLQTQFDHLPVEVYPNEDSLGQAAAESAARALRAAVRRRGQANVIVATGNSQLSF
jgi:glucosamine-6-phosphate deaminase